MSGVSSYPLTFSYYALVRREAVSIAERKALASLLALSIVGCAIRCMQCLRPRRKLFFLKFHYLLSRVAVSGSQKVLCALVCCSVGSVCCPLT